MARYGTKEVIPVDQIEKFAERLIHVAELCKDNIRAAREIGLTDLHVTHFKSGLEGVDKISKFTGAVYTAYHAASLEKLMVPKDGEVASASTDAQAVVDKAKAKLSRSRRKKR